MMTRFRSGFYPWEAAAAKRVSGRRNFEAKVSRDRLAEAAGVPLSDMEFVALMFYSALSGATRAVLESGAPAKVVVRLREELLVLCQGIRSEVGAWVRTSPDNHLP